MVTKPIFLIGMMGSGKSTLASALSKEFSIALLDTDQAIEKAIGLTVSELFLQKGEAFFRTKEKELIHALTQEPQIIACGGGLPCHNDLMQKLLNRGVVIYLEAPVKCLFDRITVDTHRPLLSSIEDFSKLFLERQAIYELAHHTLDATKSEQQQLMDLKQLLSTNLF